MGQDPATIREEIELTRDRMSERADALAYKANVPARAKDKLSQAKETMTGRLRGTAPSANELKGGARKAAGVAQENPIGLAVGAAALGFLIGMLTPVTPVEDQTLGPVADELKDRAKDVGQEAVDRGKQVAGEAAQAAKETALQSGRQHASELGDQVKEHTAAVADQLQHP